MPIRSGALEPFSSFGFIEWRGPANLVKYTDHVLSVCMALLCGFGPPSQYLSKVLARTNQWKKPAMSIVNIAETVLRICVSNFRSL